MNVENQDKNLLEKTLHPSWLNYLSQYFFSLIFFTAAVVMYIKEIELWPIAAAVLGLAVILRILINRVSFTYIITKNNVRSINGLIARNESEVRVPDIREIRVSQSIVQRLLGIGNLSFASAGTGGVEVTFEGISNPHEIKDCVNKIRNSPDTGDKKRCPQCGEFIWIKAKICPHCKYEFYNE